MKKLRSVAVWLAASGLVLGTASFAWGQQGTLGGTASGLPGASQGAGQRGASATSPTPQLPSMETDDPSLLQKWVAAWGDLVEFEILPVVHSKDTRQVVDALLDVE